MTKKNHKGRRKVPASALFKVQDLKIIGVLVFIFAAVIIYHIILKSNVIIQSENYFVYIHPHTTTEQLSNSFKERKIIGNSLSLKIWSGWKNFTPPLEGGLYHIKKGWNNYQLVKELQNQQPVPAKRFIIPAIQQRKTVIRNVAQKLALNGEKLQRLLKDTLFLTQYPSFDKESIYCLFLPGTYYIPAYSSEEDFIARMHEEFLNFWNDERLQKAEAAKLNVVEATILASIVYAETKYKEEMPLIAGVYMNRLKSNMKLEADPTLVYATSSFSSKRVYKNRKVIHPAYNTYAKKGLPPGPIHFPPKEAIDAVLNYHDHEYFYFCAKDDNTGSHSFASSYQEHKENASRYRKYLDSKKIF